MDTEILTEALKLHAYGWHPMPAHVAVQMPEGHYQCTCGRICKGKHPALYTWRQYQSVQPTIAELHYWFGIKYRIYNLGIAHGAIPGTLALDFDGPSGVTTRDELEHTCGPLPITPTLITGHGIQEIYRFPSSQDHIQTVRGLRPGMDVRATGGFSVMPPSLHYSGRSYTWDLPNPANTPLGILPPKWVDLLLEGAHPTTADTPAAAPHRNAAHLIDDGRESYMTKIVYQTYMRLYRTSQGQVEASALTSEAWQAYSADVDLTRPGRGYPELADKCHAIIRHPPINRPLIKPPVFRR